MNHFFIIVEKGSGARVGTRTFTKEWQALSFIALMGRSCDWTVKKIN